MACYVNGLLFKLFFRHAETELEVTSACVTLDLSATSHYRYAVWKDNRVKKRVLMEIVAMTLRVFVMTVGKGLTVTKVSVEGYLMSLKLSNTNKKRLIEF